MEKISFFKKVKLFRDYFKLLKSKRSQIVDKNNKLNLNIDWVGRIYTVYTCPEDVKQYGYELAEKHIKEYVGQVDKLFIELRLTEYVGIRKIEQLIEEYSELDFLIVFGFKGFDNAKFFRNLIIYSILIISSFIGSLLYFF